MTEDVGLLTAGVAAVLVAVAIGLSLLRSLGLERTILWSATRALAQLLVVGAALGLVVDDDDPIVWSFVWVVAMIGVAAWTVDRRTPDTPGVWPLAAVSFACSAIVTLGVLFGFGAFELEGRAVVPLAGMVVGNSLSATVLAARRIRAEATEHRDLIEARLALGQSSDEAFAPHVRAALVDSLTPQLESTKAVGLVSLPGAMVGLILAGVDPADAVLVQIAVMYLILGSVATTTTVMGLGLTRRLFTRDHRLVLRAAAAGPEA